LEVPSKALQRESLSKRVADSIRAAILNGGYSLGQKLREGELSKSYGVSNSVIREALHSLEGEGLVVTDPYRGRSVFMVGEEDARKLALLRTSLESLAAYLAAEQRGGEQAAKIEQLARQLKSYRPTSYEAWIDMELQFHGTVWKAARNELLSKQLNQLVVLSLSLNTLHLFKPQVRFEEVLKGITVLERTTNVQGHQLVAQSILDGDPQKARKYMILHLMGDPAFADLRHQFFQI
jgi:DNA-binding GntR family transcriptional regulator